MAVKFTNHCHTPYRGKVAAFETCPQYNFNKNNTNTIVFVKI